MADSASKEASGILTTVFDSFKSNVEERLKSPFAGAFLISWFIINWKAIYILLLSDKNVEFRVERVSEIYFSPASTIWLPLLASLAAIIVFYVLSSLYLYIYECYGVVKTKIEMQFDKIRWVSPDAYVLAKQKNQDKYDALLKLATDNTKIMDEARVRAEEAETSFAELQLKHQKLLANSNENENKIILLQSAIHDLEQNNAGLNAIVKQSSGESSKLLNELSAANALISETITYMEKTHSNNAPKSPTMSEYTEILKDKTKALSLESAMPASARSLTLANLVSDSFSKKDALIMTDKLKSHLNKVK